MDQATDVDTKTWRSRLKMTVAGFVLAGALVGGVSVVADDGAAAEDTTEEAWGYTGWGVSWR